MSFEIISGNYQFLLEKKIFFHNESTKQMNTFKNIRETFGQETLKKCRHLRRCENKLARYRNHLVFTLLCNNENIIPQSLKLKCSIESQNAKRIVERARKDLVRERIRLTTNKISELTTNWIEYEKAVNDVLPSEASERVLSLVAKSRETKFLETKWRHTEKINKLI